MPITADLKPRGALLLQCYRAVDMLEKLHFRRSDFPPFMKEAAALYDTTLSVAGLQARSFATIDLVGPYADSARILSHLNGNAEIDRFAADIARSADELRRATPVEAYQYQTFQRDTFAEHRLAELDLAAHERFNWLSSKPNEEREEWVTTLFETVAEQLELEKLFETMAEPKRTLEDRALLRAWIAHQEAWLRKTIAALPDYEERRDDNAELRDVMMQSNPRVVLNTNLEYDTDLFDLLIQKGLRRCDAIMLKLRKVNGVISHSGESVHYEHHAGFKDVDWVWLIKTTGAPQLYFQSADQPYLDDAVRQAPDDFKATLFSQEQQARAEARARKQMKRREVDVESDDPSDAPSKSVMDTIRSWLGRTN
ncbi:MAG: hypothetical protein AAFU41_07435 [Pseudomonadota bacterium]